MIIKTNSPSHTFLQQRFPGLVQRIGSKSTGGRVWALDKPSSIESTKTTEDSAENMGVERERRLSLNGGDGRGPVIWTSVGSDSSAQRVSGSVLNVLARAGPARCGVIYLSYVYTGRRELIQRSHLRENMDQASLMGKGDLLTHAACLLVRSSLRHPYFRGGSRP